MQRDTFYAGHLRCEFYEDPTTDQLVRVIVGKDNCMQPVHEEITYNRELLALFNEAPHYAAEVHRDAHEACIELFNRSKLGYTPEFCGGEA